MEIHIDKKILRPLFRGDIRLRGIICNPASSVSCILRTLSSISRFSVSVSGSLRGILELMLRLRIWGGPRVALEGHQISSQSPGQQRSCNLAPRPSEIIKNSSFCKSCCLQYLSRQMLGFQAPDIQFQTQTTLQKKTWKQA